MEQAPLQFGNTFRRLWPFFAVLSVFWAISLYWWISLGYHETFRLWNQNSFEILDQVSLLVFTHFADGLILPAIIFILFWRKDPIMAVTALIAILLTGFVAQFGKLVLFPDWQRPPVVFQNEAMVQIFHPNPPSSRSFPSGHSTSAATGGLFFALMLSHWRSWMPALVGLFTVFVASTRVIIGVHFPGDIFVGSIIGSVGGWLICLAVYPMLSKRLGRLRQAQTGRVAKLVIAISILIVIAQYIHLYLEY